MPDKHAATKNGKRRLASWLPNESRPTWEVAFLFPPQGNWTEQDFLDLDALHEAYPLVELSHGRLEVLPMPTESHQLIMLFLVRLLEAFTASHAPGIVLCAGMRVYQRVMATSYNCCSKPTQRATLSGDLLG